MVLADTNVVSEFLRPQPDRAVLRWSATAARLALSVVSIEEVVYGLTRKPNARIERAFEALVREAFDVLPVTEAVARRSAILRASGHEIGRPKSQADMLIAATADVHGLVLATRNERDFAGLGLRIVNPFRP